jgi:hypothetical protein
MDYRQISWYYPFNLSIEHPRGEKKPEGKEATWQQTCKEDTLMGTAGLIFGILAAIAAILGGLTVGGVIELTFRALPSDSTWLFWFILSGVLFLASIALNTGRTGGEY